MRAALLQALHDLVANPLLGVESDLSGVWVHQFDCVNQPYLLAYLWDEGSRTWLGLSPHKNFCRELKR